MASCMHVEKPPMAAWGWESTMAMWPYRDSSPLSPSMSSRKWLSTLVCILKNVLFSSASRLHVVYTSKLMSHQNSVIHINLVLLCCHNVELYCDISGGRHAMALTVDGKVFSWGEGDDGKLGHFSRMYVLRSCVIVVIFSGSSHIIGVIFSNLNCAHFVVLQEL